MKGSRKSVELFMDADGIVRLGKVMALLSNDATSFPAAMVKTEKSKKQESSSSSKPSLLSKMRLPGRILGASGSNSPRANNDMYEFGEYLKAPIPKRSGLKPRRSRSENNLASLDTSNAGLGGPASTANAGLGTFTQKTGEKVDTSSRKPQFAWLNPHQEADYYSNNVSLRPSTKDRRVRSHRKSMSDGEASPTWRSRYGSKKNYFEKSDSEEEEEEDSEEEEDEGKAEIVGLPGLKADFYNHSKVPLASESSDPLLNSLYRVKTAPNTKEVSAPQGRVARLSLEWVEQNNDSETEKSDFYAEDLTTPAEEKFEYFPSLK